MTDIPISAITADESAHITIDMPYMADVSVNHAYNQGIPARGVRPHVSQWLTILRFTADRLIAAVGPADRDKPVFLDLEIFAPRNRGRMPDTSNFRKPIQDVLAAALGVDDAIFSGTDVSARRVKDGESPTIAISLRWGLQ